MGRLGPLLLLCACARPDGGGPGAIDSGPADSGAADSAAPEDTAAPPLDLTVPVRLVPTDGGLGAAEATAGLAWALSHLGAAPPADAAEWLVPGAAHPTLDLRAARLPEAAWPAAAAALAPLRDSDEVAARGGVDAGRLLAATLHEPWWYYALTGACETLEGWRGARMAEPVATYGVTASLLVDADRLVRFRAGPWAAATDIAFEVETGDGVLTGEAAPLEVEVIDVLPSGQQRYALYDADGRLLPAADPAVVAAGQPGKCMWCHEGNLMSGSPENPTAPGHAPYEAWSAALAGMTEVLSDHRDGLPVAFDWADPHVHTAAELVVREFLLPTPDRAARDTGRTVAEIEALVAAGALSSARDPEWPDRGPVLVRSEIDALIEDFAPIPVLDDARDGAPVLARGTDRPADIPAPGCFSTAEAALGP